MKNMTMLIALSASALTLVGCGGNNNQSSTTKDGGAALTNQSIADGSIRLEVIAAIKELTIKARSAENDPALFKESITRLQSLLSTSTNQQEQDFLQMHSNAFSKMLKAFEIKNEEKRMDAIREDFVSLAPEQRTFVQKYIQSTQLRSVFLALQDLAQEKMYLEQHSEKQSERKAHEEKAKSIAKQMIALYDNPNLDAQTKAEFAALDKIGMFSKEIIESLRHFANSSPSPQSSEVPSLSEKVSLRRARQEGASLDFSQLMVNGVAGSQVALSTPMYVQLKGSVEGSKNTEDLTGVAVYKFDNTLVGVIHGYANASSDPHSTLNHNETSAVVSRSFGKAYLEGQGGVCKLHIKSQCG